MNCYPKNPDTIFESDPMNIFALHGFLSLGSDWNELRNQLPENVALFSPSFLSSNSPFPPAKIDLWIKQISEYIQKNIPKPRVFMGYSLGARIGLYLADHNLDLFDKFYLLSANLGLSSNNERELRYKSDQLWSKRFIEAPWSEIVCSWNSQEVFSSEASENIRHESDFCRKYLSESLTYASLAKCKDYNSNNFLCSDKLHFYIGELDKKLVTQYKTTKVKNLDIITNAGHRLLKSETFSRMFGV